MSCQQVPTTPAFNPYPRSVQVGEFEVAIGGGIWVAIGDFSRETNEKDEVAVIVTSPLTTNETWTAFGKSELLVFCEGRRLDV